MVFYILGPKLLFETTEISTHPNSTQQESNYIYLYTTKFGTSIKIRLNRKFESTEFETMRVNCTFVQNNNCEMHQQHTIHFSRSAIHQTRHQSLFPVCPACIENTSLVLIMICDQLNPQMQYQYNPLTATRKIKLNISTVCMQKQASAITKSCYFQIRNIGHIRSYITEDVCITLVRL
jgi:hypothetical protein